jgi:hypothetical protein
VLFDSRRKQAEQMARLSAGPHQHGAGIAAENLRRGKQERRLVEYIWLERVRGEFAPFGDDRLKRRQRAPLDGEGIGCVAIRNRSPAGFGNRAGGVFERNDQRRIGCGSARHSRALKYPLGRRTQSSGSPSDISRPRTDWRIQTPARPNLRSQRRQVQSGG